MTRRLLSSKMPNSDVVIRPATKADLATIGQLGASLVRLHHAFDARRFMSAGADAGTHYGAFLGTQLRRRDVVVLVAERGNVVAGYIYAEIEPRNWKELRDEAGFIHDLVVDPESRGRGIGTRLLEAALQWMRERRTPRVLLWTAAPNEAAQRLFAKAGFRTTMVEMTRELGDERQ